MKLGYYDVDYIPNKLVYVYAVDKLLGLIYFVAFFNEGNGVKPIKHECVLKYSKKDFKPKPITFEPIQSIKNLLLVSTL